MSQFYRIWTRISPSLFLSFTVKGRAPYNFLLSYEYDDSITISPQPSESETLSQPYQTNIKLNLVPRRIYHITLPSSILTQLKEWASVFLAGISMTIPLLQIKPFVPNPTQSHLMSLCIILSLLPLIFNVWCYIYIYICTFSQKKKGLAGNWTWDRPEMYVDYILCFCTGFNTK